jgi:hypothetical protein
MSNAIQGLLTLTAPQMLEEDLVDFFLDGEHQYGFTSLHVRGHSSEHSGMSAIELVTGRQQQVQFQILVNEAQAKDICQRLQSAFDGTGIHYWYLSAPLQGRF